METNLIPTYSVCPECNLQLCSLCYKTENRTFRLLKSPSGNSTSHNSPWTASGSGSSAMCLLSCRDRGQHSCHGGGRLGIRFSFIPHRNQPKIFHSLCEMVYQATDTEVTFKFPSASAPRSFMVGFCNFSDKNFTKPLFSHRYRNCLTHSLKLMGLFHEGKAACMKLKRSFIASCLLWTSCCVDDGRVLSYHPRQATSPSAHPEDEAPPSMSSCPQCWHLNSQHTPDPPSAHTRAATISAQEQWRWRDARGK